MGIPELAANQVDEISHKFLKQRRILKTKSVPRDEFWERHRNQIMVTYGKLSNEQFIMVTMDASKLGEAATLAGLEYDDEPLPESATVLISSDEYETLATFKALGIVTKITVVAGAAARLADMIEGVLGSPRPPRRSIQSEMSCAF